MRSRQVHNGDNRGFDKLSQTDHYRAFGCGAAGTEAGNGFGCPDEDDDGNGDGHGRWGEPDALVQSRSFDGMKGSDITTASPDGDGP